MEEINCKCLVPLVKLVPRRMNPVLTNYQRKITEFHGNWEVRVCTSISIILANHQRRVSQLLNTMMSSTNPAVQYIAWRSTTNTTGALGRNRAYLCIHRNLSGDSALDGHDAEVNSRISQIHELLRVRDGLDRICEFTKDDTEEFLGHISTFWCVRWVGSWRCGCLSARFCCQNSKTGLRGGRASMTWPIS